MRNTIRAIFATLLTIPLAATMATIPSAAAPTRDAVTSNNAELHTMVVGVLDGFSGNVHQVDVNVQTMYGTHASGYVYSYSCPDGVTDPWTHDEETGMPLCAQEGYATLFSEAPELFFGRRMSSATVAGTFIVLVEDQPTGASISADLSLIATSAVKTYRLTEVVTDPDTGRRSRVTINTSYREGPVTGSVNEIAVEGQGRVGVTKYTRIGDAEEG